MTTTPKSTFQFLWQTPAAPPEFRCGVSLHSHTMYSRESLSMVPHYTSKVPYLGAAVRRQEGFNFDDAYWTPPLAPRQAYRLEEKQIQRKLKLPALISLTDHDDIRAGAQLQVLERFKNVPVSTEWTIPFAETFFHLGVHNMAAGQAAQLMDRLAAFTAKPEPAGLNALLDTLHAMPDVLLILNHPLWDEKGIGADRHQTILREILTQHGQFFHALELNGLRPWRENRQVIEIGNAANLPVVSGGDRHGREPNAILNLTRAVTFPDFVHEIRRDRLSHVVFMPQYHEPLKMRILQTMVDVVRHYPENFAGRRTWADRIYHTDPVTGATVSLATLWPNGGPRLVRHFIAAMRLLEWTPFRSALRLALHDRAAAWSDQGAAI
jgi:hypothetical protein